MSLSKQLLILISLIFLVIFSINFLLSLNKIRSYLETEAQIHAQDTATSLGLSLSPYLADENKPMLETMISAIFDMGYYREIKLVNLDNRTLVRLTNDKVFSEVPGFFVNWFPMQAAAASSEISSGWMIGGTIYVSINPGFAYLKLYQLAKSSLIYALIAFIGAVFLLFSILRFVLLPLKKINSLALSIADGQFNTIDKLPWTIEVRNVAVSMNMMSQKIGLVIMRLNNKMATLGKKLHTDELTGLAKKNRFDYDMKHMFLSDTEAFMYIIKIDSLINLTKELSQKQIDSFLKKFSQSLSGVSAHYKNIQVTAYRLVGSEFALLAHPLNRKQAEDLAQSLIDVVSKLAQEYGKTDIAHIGIAPVNPYGTPEKTLAAANEAFEQAQLIGANRYFIKDDSDHAKDMIEWKNLVFDVVAKGSYEVIYLEPIKELQTEGILIEEASTRVSDLDGNPAPIGPFVAVAEKFTQIVELDQGVIRRVLDYIDTQKIPHAIAVNVSTRTIKNAEFRDWLIKQLMHRPPSGQLIFNVSTYAVTKDREAYRDFFRFSRDLGIGIMIKRFDVESLQLEHIKDLRPDYIRLTRELSNNLSHDEAKRAFIETIVQGAELLDIKIVAENVKSDEDYAAISSLGLHAASR